MCFFYKKSYGKGVDPPPCAYPEDYLHLVYVNIHPMLGDQMLYKLLILLKQGVI